jgi:Cys-rich repeat protein
MIASSHDDGRCQSRLCRTSLAIWIAAIAAALTQCAPDPRTVHCSNDTSCKERGDYNYCVNGRCVECVTNSACGAGRRCSVGTCKP